MVSGYITKGLKVQKYFCNCTDYRLLNTSLADRKKKQWSDDDYNIKTDNVSMYFAESLFKSSKATTQDALSVAN